MTPRLTVKQASNLTAEQNIHHYDELSEQAKVGFLSLTSASDDIVDNSIADEFRKYDVIKYIDYYEVSFDEPSSEA